MPRAYAADLRARVLDACAAAEVVACRNRAPFSDQPLHAV